MSSIKIIKLSALLDTWKQDNNGIKKAFLEFYDLLKSKEGIALSFKSRPGVSHSLRASIKKKGEKDRILTLMDIIDDDPENKWLSICFYAETITDPGEEGDIIPGGLLGEDGYCFDLFEEDSEMVAYLKDRINEAFEKYLSNTSFRDWIAESRVFLHSEWQPLFGRANWLWIPWS